MPQKTIQKLSVSPWVRDKAGYWAAYAAKNVWISIIFQLFCNITFIRNVYISNFSQFRSRGGGYRKSNFSQIQNSPHYPRGGGQENYVLFPQFVTFTFWIAPVSSPTLFFKEYKSDLKWVRYLHEWEKNKPSKQSNKLSNKKPNWTKPNVPKQYVVVIYSLSSLTLLFTR